MGVSTIEKQNKCSIKLSEQALLQHEAEIAEGVRESRSQYRKIVKAGISQWVKDFQKGLVRVNTVDDLKKLIELDIDLQKEDL